MKYFSIISGYIFIIMFRKSNEGSKKYKSILLTRYERQSSQNGKQAYPNHFTSKMLTLVILVKMWLRCGLQVQCQTDYIINSARHPDMVTHVVLKVVVSVCVCCIECVGCILKMSVSVLKKDILLFLFSKVLQLCVNFMNKINETLYIFRSLLQMSKCIINICLDSCLMFKKLYFQINQ